MPCIRQIHFSFFILSQTFLTLFLLKNIFMWYEWLGMHAAFQPCFLQWNKLFPTSCPICFALQYFYPFLKLTSLSLTAQKYGWRAQSALDILTCFASPRLPQQTYVSHRGGSCQKESLPLQPVRPGEEEEEEAAGYWYWDLAAPATGPSELLLCRADLLYPLVVSGHESCSGRSHLVWTCPPAFIASAGRWIYNGKASLCPSVQWGALISALSPCSTFDVINSVCSRVPGTHADIGETASQPAQRSLFELSYSVHKCQLLSKRPCKKHCIWEHNWRVTHWHQHSHKCLPLVLCTFPRGWAPKGRPATALQDFSFTIMALS